MSTYSPSLGIELIATGSQAGSWGITTNSNWQLVESAISGIASVSMADADYTLSVVYGAADEARNMVVVATGLNTAIRKIVAPLLTKIYAVVNNTTGGFAITIGGVTGTSVTIPNGFSAWVYCNGTNFYAAGTSFNSDLNVSGSLTVGGALSVSGTATLSGTSTAPTPTTGDSSVKIATTAFVQNTLTAAAYAPIASPTFTGTATAGAFVANTGTFTDTIGSLRSIPINSQTTAYVLQTSDNGQCVSITTGGVTVPNSVMSAGNTVMVYNNSGTSQTITQGTGLTLQWLGQPSSSTGSRTLGPYSAATLLFITTSNAIISGGGLS